MYPVLSCHNLIYALATAAFPVLCRRKEAGTPGLNHCRLQKVAYKCRTVCSARNNEVVGGVTLLLFATCGMVTVMSGKRTDSLLAKALLPRDVQLKSSPSLRSLPEDLVVRVRINGSARGPTVTV